MDLTLNMKQDPAPASIYYTPIDLKVGSGSRLPYLLVTPTYRPVTTLSSDWEEFMSSFFALFYCHAMLWSVDIRHGDISETNLMWDPKIKIPKLCDFDLSHSCKAPQIGVPEKAPDGPKGPSNSGTWIFMADELLTEEAMDGLVTRVYRYEVEAFIAVLVYIVCRYKGGKVRAGRPLEHWSQADYLAVHGKRSRTFREIIGGSSSRTKYPKPSRLPAKLWIDIRKTVQSMVQHQLQAVSLKAGLTIPNSGYSNNSLDDSSQTETSEDSDDSDSESDEPGPPPIEAPEDYDDLTALREKVLTWNVFKRSRAKVFVTLMKERTLNPDRQQETKA